MRQVICLYCKNEHDAEQGRLCSHCGIAVLPPTPDKEEEVGEVVRRCQECGQPSPDEASRCRGCGNPLPAVEEEKGPPLFVPTDSLRELDLPPGPPVEIARGPVRMAPAAESSNDVNLPPVPPGPPVEIARGPVRMIPPEFREVELK